VGTRLALQPVRGRVTGFQLATRYSGTFITSLPVTAGEPSRHPIVELIAGEPGMAARMLAEHTDDGSGHCRVCGPQAARQVWPCPLLGLATRASELVRDGRLRGGQA
jgi:hypothetical protein